MSTKIPTSADSAPADLVDAATPAISLDRVGRGESFTVIGIDDEMARITALRFGIAEGATASCITRLPAGPVIVRSGRQEIAIGRALARRITVSSRANGGADV